MPGHPDDMATISSEDGGQSRALDRLSALATPDESAGAGARVPVTSFAALYEEHFDFVWRSARRLGVRDAHLDDVVQDVFVTVYRKLPDFAGRSSVKTWIFGILRNTVNDTRRTARRKPVATLEHEPEDAASVGPLEATQRSEGARLLSAALSALPEEQREVFVLAELEQLSSPEIAAALALNLNTVYSRLRSARLEFEAALKRLRSRDEWRMR